ncbi:MULTISPECIES: hypothetical protein [Spiroplasma]|uniref:hypothetical protein n=1 Tax=Spiroplasma TaxID=2132 RepID=UPI0018DCE163|nr:MULTISPECIES: hypothetical protein [Spiroplasma]UNF62363.1 hypothetical protein MNU24_02550 [Spiroplasma poulsonii]
MAKKIERVICECGKEIPYTKAFSYTFITLSRQTLRVWFHCKSCANEWFEKQLIYGEVT